MKICRRCLRLYESDLQFCTDDGNSLVSRRIYEINTKNLYGNAPPVTVFEPAAAVSPPFCLPATPNRSKRNQRIGLIGLLGVIFVLSGVFVWAGVRIAVAERAAKIAGTADHPAVSAPKTKKSETPQIKNIEVAGNPRPADKAGDDDAKRTAVNEPEQTRQSNKYNGRVIMLNAVVRAAPSMEAGETAILPLDEPVQIGQPAGPNSPWFRVVTASGIKGWMHGSTIEYN